MPLERVDNNPQVFLGVQDKKGGETKPFLIPHFVITANYDGSVRDEQEIGGSTNARIILRPLRNKPKLENISLSTVGYRKRANNAQVDEYRNVTY